MLRVPRISVIGLCLVALLGSGHARSKPLQTYAIDVEGGQATLIVTPSGQSLLIDTGWPGFNGRDADRIVAAAKTAGIKKIDYVLITHYHRDHVGGVPQLSERMKIGTFVDHGPNLQDAEAPREDYAYLKVVANSHRIIVKPGDTIPLKGIKVQVLSAAGAHISEPLPGAGEANSYCGLDPEPPTDPGENARSVGILIIYGQLRLIDLGDLTRKKELELFCPRNLVGTVGLFVVSHHGFSESNSKAMVWALHPRVAIMDNGAREGGNPAAWQIVHDSPGLEDLWQLHYAVNGGNEHNVAEARIANPEENPDSGHYIKVSAPADGSFTVVNSRNNQTKIYTKSEGRNFKSATWAVPKVEN
jgi:beta-lactamase superfamily II metal-dependent hydrolase